MKTLSRPRLVAVAGLAGGMAVAAVGGAVGLASGALTLGPSIDQRLPFSSPALAGAALLLVVGVPMAVTVLAAAGGSRSTGPLAVGAGLSLLIWIVVEVAVIRTFALLQPICFAWGAALVTAGLRVAPPAASTDIGTNVRTSRTTRPCLRRL